MEYLKNIINIDNNVTKDSNFVKQFLNYLNIKPIDSKLNQNLLNVKNLSDLYYTNNINNINNINDFVEIKLPHTKSIDDNIINISTTLHNITKSIRKGEKFIPQILESSNDTFACIIILLIIMIIIILLINIL